MPDAREDYSVGGITMRCFWWTFTKVDLAWITGVCAGMAIARWDYWWAPAAIGLACGVPLWCIEHMEEE